MRHERLCVLFTKGSIEYNNTYIAIIYTNKHVKSGEVYMKYNSEFTIAWNMYKKYHEFREE